MLVLKRKEGEKIIIGDREITIVVVEVNRDSVRLGIEAPKDVTVHREEIFNQIEEKKHAAE